MTTFAQYCKVFTEARSEQIGRLYIVLYQHARGRTLDIYVLPAGGIILEENLGDLPKVENAIKVYGIVDGQAGWETGAHGWIHEGGWEDEFNLIVTKRLLALKNIEEKDEEERKRTKDLKDEKQQKLISAYREEFANDKPL